MDAYTKWDVTPWTSSKYVLPWNTTPCLHFPRCGSSWVRSNPCGQQLLIVYAWADTIRWRLLPLSASYTHTYMQTHFISPLSRSLPLSVSLPSLSLSLYPTCTEVCVQTDCTKMAAAQPTGFCCVACSPFSPRRNARVALGAKKGHRRRKGVCPVWIHASHRRGQDAMNPHGVPSPAGCQGRG